MRQAENTLKCKDFAAEGQTGTGQAIGVGNSPLGEGESLIRTKSARLNCPLGSLQG